MPSTRSLNRRIFQHCATLLLAATGVAGCAEGASAPLPDVPDPLLSMDAHVSELPPWQGPEDTVDAGLGDGATNTDGNSGGCVPGAQKSDGSCCATGLFWDTGSGACLPAGPTGCFKTGAEDASLCVPRWCFAYVDGSGKSCTPGPESCRATPAACPANAGDLQVGCPAGESPSPGCAPAGTVTLPTHGAVPTLWSDGAPLPELSTPTDAPPPPSAPQAVAAPTWCSNGAGAIIDAAANAGQCVTTACVIGVAPDPDAPGTCLDVAGPKWSCPLGFLGDGATCLPDPADCSDPWGGVAPGANVVFVSAAAAVGGTGTQAAPFQTLADAIGALPAGGTIAVGAGTYVGNISLLQPITLRGACAQNVTLQGVAGKPNVLIAEKSGSQLSGVTLKGGRYGIRVEGAVKASADHVLVYTAEHGGLSVVDGADVAVKNAVVLNTLPGDNGTLGRGIAVEAATLDVSATRLINNRTVGLYAADSTVTAKGLVIDNTLTQQSDSKGGFGLHAVGTGSLTATDLRVTTSRGYGVRIEESVAALGSNWYVTGTQPTGDQSAGVGVAVFTANLKVTDLRVTFNRQHGLWIADTGATFSGHNVRVSDTQGQVSDNTGGDGVVVEGSGATGQFAGLYVQNSRAHGVSVAGQDAALGVDFAVIDTTLPRASDQTSGSGLEVVDGAKLLLPANGTIRIANSYTNGFLVSGGTWQGGSIFVQNTQSRLSDGKGGEGAVIESGAQVSNVGLHVSASQANGIIIASKTTLVTNANLEATLTTPRTSDNSGGGGVLIAEGARVSGAVAAIGNVDYGLTLDGAGSQFDGVAGPSGKSVFVAWTKPRPDGHGGDGIQIIGGGSLSASGVTVQHSYGHGIFVYSADSGLVASHVVIRDTGANTSPGWGRGISVSHGAHTTLSDVDIRGSESVGLFFADTATTATVDDLTIDGGTRAVAIQSSVVASGHRWRLQNCTEVGLLVSGYKTFATLRDLAVSNVGVGIEVRSLANVVLTGAAIVGVKGIGALVDGGVITGPQSVLDAVNVRISDVSGVGVVDSGHGVVAQAGALLRVAGLVLRAWDGIGIFGHSAAIHIGGARLDSGQGAGIAVSGGEFTLSGARVQNATGVAWAQVGGKAGASECAWLTPTPDKSGKSNGIELTGGATATLDHALVFGAKTTGILASGAKIGGDRVRVSGNAAGLTRETGVADDWLHSLFFDNADKDIVDPGSGQPTSLPSAVTALDTSATP